MKNLFKIIIILGFFIPNSFGQEKPKRFKLFPKDSINLKRFYDFNLSYFELKKGEKIASIGAGDGSLEVELAVFNEDIDWTLNDIDSASLNPIEFKKVLDYFENIIHKPIKGKFSFVIGEERKTNLSENTFDRILLNNVYHELSDKQVIMSDIHRALKVNGLIVIMEVMAGKLGQRHQGCNRLKPWEPDFLKEMDGFNFKLVKKNRPKKKLPSTFYFFERM